MLREISRQALAAELRLVWPVLIHLAIVLLASVIAYCLGSIGSARYFSKKNMPGRAQEHIDTLAIKLLQAELERDRLGAENEAMRSRLQGLSAHLQMPVLAQEAEQRRLRVVKR